MKLTVKIYWFAQGLLCFLISIVMIMVTVEKIIKNGALYEVGSSGGGVLFEIPQNPTQGMLYWNNASNRMYIYDGTNRRNALSGYIMGTFEEYRGGATILYESSNGKITHGYNSTFGEIELKKSNGDTFIIADRDLGAMYAGTTKECYGEYYGDPFNTTLPTGYHIPSQQESNTLKSFLTSIQGGSMDNPAKYLLMPLSGYYYNGGLNEEGNRNHSWQTTANSGGRYYLLMTSTGTGNYAITNDNNAMSPSSNNRATIRLFKDT